MAVCGVSFALWYRALRRGPGVVGRDDEVRLYVLVLVVASAGLTAELYLQDLHDAGDALRHGVFQSVSIVTTTGFATTDFATWTPLTLVLLILLMFVGGCAGSTTGGIKVVRFALVGLAFRRELRTSVHPEAVVPVRVSGRLVDDRAIRSALVFVLLYLLVFPVGTVTLLVDASVQGLRLEPLEAISASASAIGNGGPGVG